LFGLYSSQPNGSGQDISLWSKQKMTWAPFMMCCDRHFFLADLWRNIADILVMAYMKKGSSAHWRALFDAECIAHSILDRRLFTSR
jgi:hypothetical protein